MCRLLNAGDYESLDVLLLGMDGPIEQSWNWGELQSTIPGRPQFYVWGVFEGDGERPGAMIASVMVIRQTMGLGKTWLWCPRGPVLPTDPDLARNAWRRLKEACDTMAHRHGDVFLRVEPGSLPDGVDLSGTVSKESYLPAHTLVLDLSLSEDALLQQMAQKGRYNIKIADREGVTVREGAVEDIPAFYAVLQETGARDGFGVHAEAFYHEFMNCLGPAAHLYLAEKEGVLLGGLLATHWGDTATYYFGASSQAHRSAMAPYALQWAAIRVAKKAGLRWYDFLGVAPEGDAAHALAGVTQFKTRFGGQRVIYSEPRLWVYRPLWWGLRRLWKRLRGRGR